RPNNKIYDALLADLEANLPSVDVALETRDNGTAQDSPDGIYVLFVGDVFVGAANLKFEDDILRFTALFEEGQQMRGQGSLQDEYYIMKPESGGLERDRGIVAVQGVASPKGGGVIECVGDDRETRFSCVAYQ